MSSAPTDVLQRHRLTVDQYRRIGEAGILEPDSPVELIEGEIIDMPPIGSRHAGTVVQLVRVLERAVGDLAIVWPQSSIVLDAHETSRYYRAAPCGDRADARTLPAASAQARPLVPQGHRGGRALAHRGGIVPRRLAVFTRSRRSGTASTPSKPWRSSMPRPSSATSNASAENTDTFAPTSNRSSTSSTSATRRVSKSRALVMAKTLLHGQFLAGLAPHDFLDHPLDPAVVEKPCASGLLRGLVR
jgi:hypothetical protein